MKHLRNGSIVKIQAAIRWSILVLAVASPLLAALPEAVIRVIDLAKDMQTSQPIPGDWLMETEKQFPQSRQSLSVGQLQALGEADGMRRPVSPAGCDMLPGRRTPVGANKETSHEEDYHCFVAVRAAEDKPDQTRWQGDAA